jgi:tetratricopeptide (TPR) repeat protein
VVAPEGALGTAAWAIGPPADALEKAAERRAASALAALLDPERSSDERLQVWHEELRVAERLLLLSLRERPASATALAQLAAVRWELGLPDRSQAQARAIVDTIGLAASVAPGMPEIQTKLGELLLDLGRPSAAREALRRAIDLDAGAATAVVDLLRARGLSPGQILDGFGDLPSALVALAPVFREAGKTSEWLDAADRWLEASTGPPPAGLLAAYGGGCLATGAGERLARRLDASGPLAGRAGEAERLKWRARAHLMSGRRRDARSDALAALALAPAVAGYAEFAGQTQLLAADAAGAAGSFRLALAGLAREGAGASDRARLYAAIGRAEEEGGNLTRAYDAYRMALDLHPTEPDAREGMERMRQAAGGQRHSRTR